MRKILVAICFVAISLCGFAEENFAGTTDPESVIEVCNAVAEWEIANHSKCGHHDLDWTNGALYAGMIEWGKTSGNADCIEFVRMIGERNKWLMNMRVYHADDICVGQAFIDLYRMTKDSRLLQPVLERAYYVATHPSKSPLSKKDEKGKDERWSWCDALFMAPPVYAALYEITGEKVFADYMDNEFRVCTDSLYNRDYGLYFRDCMRIPLREPNGERQFWARGNGWVFAGIPRILDNLPDNHPTRFYYLDIFKEMAQSIVALQDSNGAWHASLLDCESYPAPENSASAFFCYGLAWGINEGILEGETYTKALSKGWASLVSYVDRDGMLGYVQPVGSAPVSVNEESTDVYGAGAFLLAGSELLEMNRRKP